MRRLLHDLRALRPDCVADLHNVLRSWIIDNYMRLHGVRVVMVDKNRSKRRKLLSEKVPQTGFITRYADVMARLGFPWSLPSARSTTTPPPGPPSSPSIRPWA